MNSTDKIYALLEFLQDQDDNELADAIQLPLPPAFARGALMAVAGNLPADPAELDRFLTDVSQFCLSLCSDREPALAELEEGDVA